VVVAAGVAVLGLILLVVAGNQLVLGSARLAEQMRVSRVVVGVVVIGFGTSTPELLVSGFAAVQGEFGLAAGNLVGSNVLNVTLVLGVAGLLAPVTVRSAVLRREAPLSVGAVAAFGVVLLLGPDRLTGAVLAALFVAVAVIVVRSAAEVTADPLARQVADYVDARSRWSAGVQLVRAVGGLAGTLLGARLVVDNAVEIAVRLRLPQAFVGFSLVALGTSLPELVAAVQAQRRGESDLLIGNLLGSNLFNSLAGGALIGLAGGGSRSGEPPIQPSAVGLMVVTSLLAWLLMARGSRLVRVEAAVLLAGYAVTVPLLLR
jgi:cation:H+ antiporter